MDIIRHILWFAGKNVDLVDMIFCLLNESVDIIVLKLLVDIFFGLLNEWN